MGFFGYDTTDKIISLIPMMGQKINMKDGENEYFTEDDGLICCNVKSGILVELSSSLSGETIGICNKKINILKKYFIKNGFEYYGKFQYGIFTEENFGNEKCKITINPPKGESFGGFTSFFIVKILEDNT